MSARFFFVIDPSFLKILFDLIDPYTLKQLRGTSKRLKQLCDKYLETGFTFYGQKSFKGGCVSASTNLDDGSLEDKFHHPPVNNIHVVNIHTMFITFQTACQFCAKKFTFPDLSRSVTCGKYPKILLFDPFLGVRVNSSYIYKNRMNYPIPVNRKFSSLMVKEKFFLSLNDKRTIFKRMTCYSEVFNSFDDPCCSKYHSKDSKKFPLVFDKNCFDQWFLFKENDHEKMIEPPDKNSVELIKEKSVYYVRKLVHIDKNVIEFVDYMDIGEVHTYILKTLESKAYVNNASGLIQYHREAKNIQSQSEWICGQLSDFVSEGSYRYEDWELGDSDSDYETKHISSSDFEEPYTSEYY